MSEIPKEIGVSTLKTLFNAIPFIGSGLNEAVFECRSRVKQNRLNQFSLELEKYMRQHGLGNINLDYIKSEQFGDVFESILKKVMETGNQNKLLRFKNILIGQLKSQQENDFIETFLDITSKLNDVQIQILELYSNSKSGDVLNYTKAQIRQLERELEIAEKKVEELKNKARLGTIQPYESITSADNDIIRIKKELIEFEESHNQFEINSSAEHFGVTTNDYSFFMQDLVSKSLMKDTYVILKGIGNIPVKGITEFGIRYINFIKSY